MRDSYKIPFCRVNKVASYNELYKQIESISSVFIGLRFLQR